MYQFRLDGRERQMVKSHAPYTSNIASGKSVSISTRLATKSDDVAQVEFAEQQFRR